MRLFLGGNFMINKLGKDKCTGCNNCYNICPQNAITMIPDDEGFWYPAINHEKCTRCGLCSKQCPVMSGLNSDNFSTPYVYAAWNRDEDIRINSTSGGIFTELATYIISIGGCVVGAKYNEDLTVAHYIINRLDDIEKLRQSKYMQSDIGLIFREIKRLISSGRIVLFCGTPCQNAGLMNFLGNQLERLYLCDFICRGVISPKVYKKYIDMLESKYHNKVKRIQFKDKTYGWNRFGTMVEFENGRKYIRDRYSDLYMVGYLEYNLYLRPSCHNCNFKKLPRNSDLTLGDFWGISKTRPHLDADKGTSVVIVNSIKGQQLFDNIKKNIYCEECQLSDVISENTCLLNSTPVGKYREEFFENLSKMRFDNALKKAVKYFGRNQFKKWRFYIILRIKHAIRVLFY
jgi:coenzyme F420-reducing hydrogenase beta subunit